MAAQGLNARAEAQSPQVCRKSPVDPGCTVAAKLRAMTRVRETVHGGIGMRRFSQKPTCGLALLFLAPLIEACSSDYAINLPRGALGGPARFSFSGHKEQFTLPPAGPEDLLDADGQCAAAVPVPTSEAAAGSAEPGSAQSGIALQMTECDVVRRAGPPERVEFGTGNAGERSVVLKYIHGARPGIYRFAAGRLFSIERAPESAAAARQPKASPAKKRP